MRLRLGGELELVGTELVEGFSEAGLSALKKKKSPIKTA
jgi:hypothetical protein